MAIYSVNAKLALPLLEGMGRKLTKSGIFCGHLIMARLLRSWPASWQGILNWKRP